MFNREAICELYGLLNHRSYASYIINAFIF